MKAGPFKTKKEAVEAGLLLLKRQAAYREILKYRGQLKWGWEDEAAEALPTPAASPARKGAKAAAAQVAEAAQSCRTTPSAKAEKARGRR